MALVARETGYTHFEVRIDSENILTKISEEISIAGSQKIKATIQAGQTVQVLNLLAVNKAAIELIFIKASQYDDGTGKLQYSFQNNATKIKLTSPHVYRKNIIAVLAPVDPFTLEVDNTFAQDVNLEILCFFRFGSKAT